MREHPTVRGDARGPSKTTTDLPAFAGWLEHPPRPDEGYCTARDAAEIVGSNYHSMKTARTTATGRLGRIPFYKVRDWNVVMYRVRDLEAFVAECGRLDARRPSKTEG